MNGGKCTHGAVSSSGELFPKTSGTRSELGNGSFSRPLEGREFSTSVTWRVGLPDAQWPRCSGEEIRPGWV